MTSTISRSVLTVALALGLLIAVSAPSHAALSTADRSQAATAAPAPAEAPATVAALADARQVAKVAAPVAAAAAPAAPIVQPRKTIAPKAMTRRVASVAPRTNFFAARRGYPCH